MTQVTVLMIHKKTDGLNQEKELSLIERKHMGCDSIVCGHEVWAFICDVSKCSSLRHCVDINAVLRKKEEVPALSYQKDRKSYCLTSLP